MRAGGHSATCKNKSQITTALKKIHLSWDYMQVMTVFEEIQDDKEVQLKKKTKIKSFTTFLLPGS